MMQTPDLAVDLDEQEMLLQLFRLCLSHIDLLVDNESWEGDLLTTLKCLVSGSPNREAMTRVMHDMSAAIQRRNSLRPNLAEAKSTVNAMVSSFLDELTGVAETTDAYQQKLEKFAEVLSATDPQGVAGQMSQELAQITRETRERALRSREHIESAKEEVLKSQQRIRELETRLDYLNELVHEDQLTGCFNRRGFDEQFMRERARAVRRKSPLCAAVLDLDNFKLINDNYGHTTGDQALQHLVVVFKNTLRTMDVIARLGGEEFALLLPDTPLTYAELVVNRLRHALAQSGLTVDGVAIHLTFSAGVAAVLPDETQNQLLDRADKAMYQAKRTGKDRVIIAPAE